ncbi:MAG: NAD(P)-dependent glycerol-3-phosphate dehydrogenase [Marinicaulis sp.]|nr:NAD(P)-dependent glycerol-3-phosphate dehydrogenase [Marinicaulis sp.]NNL88972.1 NAD(P)-dependent glycerol-3-phosphate dehydrogenase [Marinicaulis sp.]
MNGAAPFDTISVIGGGAWGTALASLCAANGRTTLLWAREPSVVESINAKHENIDYLPGIPLSADLSATGDLKEAAKCEAALFVVPSQFARSVLVELQTLSVADLPIALCSKGIEQSSGLLMIDVLRAVWPDARSAVLSGPSFAADVARGLPTAVTLACQDDDLCSRWAASIGAAQFRPYLSRDLIGAELGGAVKNVLAIAAGVVDGKGLGESARAALIARGFAEFQRLGVAMGADRQTMAGLSGLGDLILTASSPQSRNMSLGRELGKGRKLESIIGERNSVAEGVATAPALLKMAKKYGIDMPIASAVAALTTGAVSVDDAIKSLLTRPITKEG